MPTCFLFGPLKFPIDYLGKYGVKKLVNHTLRNSITDSFFSRHLHFYVGNLTEFDNIALEILHELEPIYRFTITEIDTYSLLPSCLRNKKIPEELNFEDITNYSAQISQYPEEMLDVNKELISQCDEIICYADPFQNDYISMQSENFAFMNHKTVKNLFTRQQYRMIHQILNSSIKDVLNCDFEKSPHLKDK